jgi:hypothetical protein
MPRTVKERMSKSTPVLLATAAILSVSGASASACDLHGPGQFGGFHRYNPFASALQNAPTAKAPKQSAKAETEASGAKTEVSPKEAKRRQEALEKAAERSADEGSRADFFDRSDRSSIR